MDNEKKTCPHCGYCPTCGRGPNYPHFQPYTPYWVYPHFQPYPYTITTTGITTNTPNSYVYLNATGGQFDGQTQ